MKRCVLVYSGGMDSTTLLHWLKSEGYEVVALSFDYGQRHRVELDYAAKYASHEAVVHRTVDLSTLSELLPGSSQTDSKVDVPHGHYAEESMKLTVVPNRNMVMLSIAIAHAVAIKADAVAYGAHAGDHAIYPDCRPEFAEAMNDAAALADWHVVEVLAPFLEKDKKEIGVLGRRLGVRFADTWTCYDPQGERYHERACGECGACVERREALGP